MQKVKFLLTLSVFMLATGARADVLVDSQPKSDFTPQGMSYGYNAKLGRAWINVEYHNSVSCVPSTYYCGATSNTIRTKVTGLSFDAATGAVLFAENGQAPIMCASLVKHWYGMSLKPSGLCGLTRAEETTKVIDDGYETREVRTIEFYFGKLTRNARRGD